MDFNIEKIMLLRWFTDQKRPPLKTSRSLVKRTMIFPTGVMSKKVLMGAFMTFFMMILWKPLPSHSLVRTKSMIFTEIAMAESDVIRMIYWMYCQ